MINNNNNENIMIDHLFSFPFYLCFFFVVFVFLTFCRYFFTDKLWKLLICVKSSRPFMNFEVNSIVQIEQNFSINYHLLWIFRRLFCLTFHRSFCLLVLFYCFDSFLVLGILRIGQNKSNVVNSERRKRATTTTTTNASENVQILSNHKLFFN